MRKSAIERAYRGYSNLLINKDSNVQVLSIYIHKYAVLGVCAGYFDISSYNQCFKSHL